MKRAKNPLVPLMINSENLMNMYKYIRTIIVIAALSAGNTNAQTGPAGLGSNVVLWLKAGDLVSSSTTWQDASVSTQTGTLATSPVITDGSAFNYNASLTFDGSQYVSLPSGFANFTAGMSVYAVYKVSTASGNYSRIIDFGNAAGTDNIILYRENNTTYLRSALYNGGSVSNYMDLLEGFTTDDPKIMEFVYDPNGTDYLRGNNREQAGTANTPSNTTRTKNYIGKSNWSGDPIFKGQMAEIIILNAAATTQQRDNVRTYLQLKYGVDAQGSSTATGSQIAGARNLYLSDNSLIWTNDAVYNYRLFGIARDDASTLLQKQSTTVEPGGYFSVSLGPMAANNASNTGTFPSDKSAFVLADNNKNTRTYTAVAGLTGTNRRLARSWKVQHNLVNTSVRFTLLDNCYGGSIIVSSDSAFSSSGILGEYPIVNGVATINSNNIPQGTSGSPCYITVGTLVKNPAPSAALSTNLWLRSDYEASSTQWLDYSGALNHAKLATSGTPPALSTASGDILNYHRPMKTYSASAFQTISGVFGKASNQHSVFVVGNKVGSGQHTPISEDLGGTARWSTHLPWSDDVIYYDFPNTTSGRISKWYGNPQVTEIWNWDLNNAQQRIWKTRSLFASKTNNTVPVSLWTNTLVGADGGSRFYEIIMNNGGLDSLERQKIQSYLAFKYGMTLNQGTSGYSYIASDGSSIWLNAGDGYHVAVFGIGRDDNSGLNQKQATPYNYASYPIAVSLGTSFGTLNQDNTNVFTNDMSFLAFSTNVASPNQRYDGGQVTFLSSGTQVRQNQVWKIQKSSQFATQNVTFNFGPASVGLENRYVILSTSATFSSISSYHLIGSNGLVTISSADLVHGSFMTLAADAVGPAGIVLGLEAWWKADAGISAANGAEVLTWEDASTNSNSATGSSPYVPKYYSTSSSNFNPRLWWDGYVDLLNPEDMHTIRHSAWVVRSEANDNEWRHVLYGGGSTAGSNNTYYYHAGQGTLTYNQGSPNSTTITNWRLDGQSVPNGTTAHYNDQTTQGGGTPKTNLVTFDDPTPSSVKLIGHQSSWAYRTWWGDMYEITLYNRQLTAIENQKLESYLALKYGVSILDQSMNYVNSLGTTYWTMSMNTGYNNHIMGIGRDDLGQLHQRQARSANTSILTIGNAGIIGVSNSSSTGNDLSTDNSFLLVGSDAGSLTWQSADVPTSDDYLMRIGRVWKIQETGTVSTVRLSFPAPTSALSQKLPNFSTSYSLDEVYLLVDADGTFATGATKYPLTLVGTDYVIDIDLLDGMYFTVAANSAPALSLNSYLSVTPGLGGCTNLPTDPWSFTIDDFQEDEANLLVTATSSNTTLLPNANVILSTTGASMTVTMQPATGETGTTTVTIHVQDGSLTTSSAFTFEVADPKIETSTSTMLMIPDGYVAGTGYIVDPNISIGQPSNTAAKAKIWSNYSSGDQLYIDPSSLPAGISTNWNTTLRTLEITGAAISAADMETVFNNIKFKTTSTSTANRKIVYSLGNAFPNIDNGHAYVPSTYQTCFWNAVTDAEALTYLGIEGYLATVTTQSEKDFVATQLPAGWTWISLAYAGGSSWTWRSGPEKNQTYTYSSWCPGEPNNLSDEHYAGQSGWCWNNLTNCNYQKFLTEFGGMPSDRCARIFTTRDICFAPALATTTVCPPISSGGLASVTITAPLGGGLEYSLDGISYQSSPSFTPSPGSYTVYVKNANGCISENAITVPSFATFSWNGASWNNCALPTTTDDVSFTGNYTLSNSGVIRQFGNVSVSTGVVITIAPGEKMDVQDLALAGTAKIIIQADATGFGQLKINGTLSGTGTVEHQQYVPSLGWHMVSSSTTNGFGTTTGATASNLMPYNASSGAWSSSLGGVGTGYFGHVDASSSSAFMSAAGAFSVEGTPNTSHTFNLGYATAVASGGAGNGWNLIGNPYTCILDASTLTGTNVNSGVYIWNGSASGSDASNYNYYSGSGLGNALIAPLQGFWVQATGTGGSITTTMASNGTMSGSSTFFKSKPDHLLVSVTALNDAAITDTAWVAHVVGATKEFDGALDAWKMTNGSALPNISTGIGSQKMAINALEIQNGTVLPLDVSYATMGNKFYIDAQKHINAGDWDVYLEDKLLSQLWDLSHGPYTYSQSSWTDESPRFALHLSRKTVGLEDPSAPTYYVYQNGQELVLHCPGCVFEQYQLVAADGRVVAQGRIQEDIHRMSAPQYDGLYTLQLMNSHTVDQIKVVVVNEMK